MAKVILQVKGGPTDGARFEFAAPNRCLVGRDPSCRIHFPPVNGISRLQCQFEIIPPHITVRDLYSKEGTLHGQTCIGKRPDRMSAEEALGKAWPFHRLRHGDEVFLGDSRVAIKVEVHGEDDSFTEDDLEAVALNICEICGVVLSGSGLSGAAVFCDICRNDHQTILGYLLSAARRPLREIIALQGYQVVREIANEPGTALVARAPHGDLVAIKLVNVGRPWQGDAQMRFEQQLETARTLQYPHIAALRDFWRQGDRYFLVSEFGDGCSLARFVQERGGTLEVEEAMPLLFQALDALHQAHSEWQVIHGSITPFILQVQGSPSGARELKIADWGLMPGFAQPPFKDREVALAADVRALAATFLWALSGESEATLPPTTAQTYNLTGVPPLLAAVFKEALRTANKDRFKSALALRQALQNAL